METDAHKLVGRYQDNAKMQAQAAQASRNDLAQQAWTTLDQNLQALKRTLSYLALSTRQPHNLRT